MDQHPWRLGPRGRRWLDGLLVLGVLVLGGAGHLAAGQPVMAALAGLAACVLPARKAARVTPAAGLALD